MSRKTNFIVYVDKDVMTKPTELGAAVHAHLIKKDLDIKVRKVFFAQFMKAPTDKHRMAVIESWVQVRDVTDFPFRKEAQVDKLPGSENDVEQIQAMIESGELIPSEEEQDTNTEAEGGVPVDEGADGEEESDG